MSARPRLGPLARQVLQDYWVLHHRVIAGDQAPTSGASAHVTQPFAKYPTPPFFDRGRVSGVSPPLPDGPARQVQGRWPGLPFHPASPAPRGQVLGPRALGAQASGANDEGGRASSQIQVKGCRLVPGLLRVKQLTYASARRRPMCSKRLRQTIGSSFLPWSMRRPTCWRALPTSISIR